VVRRQLGDLGTKINQHLQPVFTSKKIADHLRVTEEKPPLINQQSVVYEFICDLYHTNYIGYTCRHLHQRVEEHKHSVIGKHFWDAHGLTPTNLIKNFKVLMKCHSKLDCLIYEMLWIKNKGPKLNTQTDSICTKLFTWMLSCQFIFSLSKSINVPFHYFNLFIWHWWHEVVETSCYFTIVNFLA